MPHGPSFPYSLSVFASFCPSLLCPVLYVCVCVFFFFGFLGQNLRLSFCRIAVKRGFCNESNMMLNVVRKICEMPLVYPRMQNFSPVIQFTQGLLGPPTHLDPSRPVPVSHLSGLSIFPFPSVFRTLFQTHLSIMWSVP